MPLVIMKATGGGTLAGNRGRFRGKVALVTGGSTGIGFAAARAFALEGAQVVITGRRQEQGDAAVASIAREGGDIRFLAGDMADPQAIRAVIAETVACHGRLDFAFNNAGRSSSSSTPIYEADEQEFEEILAVNTRGVWYATKYQMGEMLKTGGGAIVICGSVASIRGGTGKASAYYTSKHAIMGLTKQAALDGARHGIRVNAVLPGLVMTELIEKKFVHEQDRLTQHFAKIPLGRPGEGKEIADAVLFLCSDESSYITGVGLPVDGGYSV